MDQSTFFELLEDKFLTYEELSSVAVEDNGEPMIQIVEGFSVRAFAIDEKMRAYTGDEVYVRKSVIDKLKAAQAYIESFMPKCSLEVVYGYRHPAIQADLFETVKKKLIAEQSFEDEEDLKEHVHFFIAVPEVAGHPTGGAVDIRILDEKGNVLDMGTEVHEFVKNTYVHSPFIAKEAWHRRQLLRLSMTMAGFAPFDGEWWHFSYGDREWARYYQKPKAIYSQIEFQSVP